MISAGHTENLAAASAFDELTAAVALVGQQVAALAAIDQKIGDTATPDQRIPALAAVEDKLDAVKAAIDALHGAKTLDQLNWAALIGNASTIDFVVQGWDGWMEKYDADLQRFFSRGGKFSLFVYDHESERAAPYRGYMGDRLGKAPHDVNQEIKGTITKLRELREELTAVTGTPGSVEIIRMVRLNWYFAARFRGTGPDDVVVFSVYSHTKQNPYKMPAVTIQLDTNAPLQKWFEAELQHLRPD